MIHMKYKYSRWQLFAKRLNVPKDVQIKIYNHNLSLKEFINYDLIDKIPFNCLAPEARELAKFKCRNTLFLLDIYKNI